jgi:hypothetical protein
MLLVNATIFTAPGALLLWAVEAVFSRRIRSERMLDAATVALGALVGATSFAGMSQRGDAALDWASIGFVYGAPTAMSFVVIQRWVRARVVHRH